MPADAKRIRLSGKRSLMSTSMAVMSMSGAPNAGGGPTKANAVLLGGGYHVVHIPFFMAPFIRAGNIYSVQLMHDEDWQRGLENAITNVQAFRRPFW